MVIEYAGVKFIETEICPPDTAYVFQHPPRRWEFSSSEGYHEAVKHWERHGVYGIKAIGATPS